MNRCTEWRGEHAAVIARDVNYIDRLAQYEDTGMEPEEIAGLLGDLREIPFRRLIELVKAEINGLVKTMPPDRENTCGTCGHFTRKPGEGTGSCAIRPGPSPFRTRTCCKKYEERREES